MAPRRQSANKTRGSAIDFAWLEEVVVGALVIAVPLVFWKSAFRVFALPKATLLVCGIWLLLAIRWLGGRDHLKRHRLEPSLLMACGAFVLMLALSTVFAEDGWGSLTGSPHRYSGALTWFSYIMLFLLIATRSKGQRPLERLVSCIVVSHLGVLVYSLVQIGGVDPWRWAESLSYGIQVTSTLGNPNFVSAFLAMSLPLVIGVILRSGIDRRIAACSGSMMALTLLVINHMGSTQGHVVVVACVLPVIYWSAVGPWRAKAAVLGAVGLLAISVLVVMGDVHNLGWVLGGVFGTGLWGLLCAEFGSRRGQCAVDDSGFRWRPSRRALIAGGVPVLAAGLGLLPFALRLVASNLDERRLLWSAGWKMFAERPVLGWGLSSYANNFARLRPAEHAERFGGFLSDSVHSVPFGLMIGGGAVLLLAYLSLQFVVLRVGLRGFARRDQGVQQLTVVLGSSWVAFHLQSLVSVDSVSLGYFQWVISGLLVATANRSSEFDQKGGRQFWQLKFIGDRCPDSLPRLASGALIVCGLFLIPTVTAPLRADLAFNNAHWAEARRDLTEMRSELDRAVRLDKRNGFLLEKRAHLLAGTGQLEAAIADASRAAELLPGSAAAAAQVARYAAADWATSGRLSFAREWYRLAIERDPHSTSIVDEFERFLLAIGRVSEASELRRWHEAL